MTANRDFWVNPESDEAVLAEYIAEHGGLSYMEGDDTFVFGFGDADRLPGLPTEGLCINCVTPVRWRGELGWKHELGFCQTGGCTEARPMP
jgi:hypothetical protein